MDLGDHQHSFVAVADFLTIVLVAVVMGVIPAVGDKTAMQAVGWPAWPFWRITRLFTNQSASLTASFISLTYSFT